MGGRALALPPHADGRASLEKHSGHHRDPNGVRPFHPADQHGRAHERALDWFGAWFDSGAAIASSVAAVYDRRRSIMRSVGGQRPPLQMLRRRSETAATDVASAVRDRLQLE